MFWYLLIIGILALLPSCHGHDHDHNQDEQHGHEHQAGQENGHDDDHGHEHPANGDHDHDSDHHHGDRSHSEHDGSAGQDHGHGHEETIEAFTSWRNQYQLYIEFPPLVVGRESVAAAHLTRLSDHLPIEQGQVTLVLSGGSVPLEEFKIETPARAGIFRPLINPNHAGLRHLSLSWQGDEGRASFELGEVRVYAAADQIKARGHNQEEMGRISLLLEQQWRVPFRLGQVAHREVRPSLAVFARLTSPSDAETVLHAPRDGRITSKSDSFPIVGLSVDKGAELFSLATVPGDGADQASLDLAVDQASIRLKSARIELDRVKPLADQRVVARRRLDEANANWEAARAELQAAERRRQSVLRGQDLAGRGETIAVPSPLRGNLAELFVAPDEWVLAGQRLARIVDRRGLWLDVSVPESYVGRLNAIAGVWCRFSEGEPLLEIDRTSLVSIATEVDSTSRTLAVRFSVDNPDGRLFAGMTTRAFLMTDAPRRGLVVPVDSLIDDGGLDVVYVQTAGESFERRVVRTGIRDGDVIEILDGVKEGEWIVTQGGYAVRLAATSTDNLGHGHAH